MMNQNGKYFTRRLFAQFGFPHDLTGGELGSYRDVGFSPKE
jgi:hypothetical protein